MKRGLKNFSSLDQGYAEDEKLENLIDAIRSKDIPAIKKALADCKGLDINYFYAWSGEHQSVIGEAVSTGNIEIVKLILDAGGDINTHCGECAERSTAGIAAGQGNLELLKFLLDNGAKASGDTDGEPGYRPITQAIRMGRDPAIIELLLDYDSSPRVLDREDCEGFTPLAMAAYDGNLACAKLLVEAGADVNKKCSEGTPLQIAEEKGHTKVANYLRSVMGESRKGKNFSRRRGVRNFARYDRDLYYYNGEGNTLAEKCEIINRLLFGTNRRKWKTPKGLREFIGYRSMILNSLDYQDEIAKRTLMAVNQLMCVLDYLMGESKIRPKSLAVYEPAEILSADIGLNKDIWESDVLVVGRTNRRLDAGRLLEEAHKDDPDIDHVNELIRRGASVNATDEHGNTPLMIAAQNRHIDMVNLLINAGSNVNQQNDAGNTALHLAHSPAVILALIDAGANPRIRNKHRRKAWEQLEDENFHQIEFIPCIYEIGNGGLMESVYCDSIIDGYLRPGEVNSKEFIDDFYKNLEKVEEKIQKDKWAKNGGSSSLPTDKFDIAYYDILPYQRFADMVDVWKLDTPEIPRTTFAEKLALFLTVAERIYSRSIGWDETRRLFNNVSGY